MTLTLIKNKDIKSNKKKFDSFLENFHENYKEFTIDCESLNVDYFNSETIVKIRHRRPVKDSIYYAETYKSKNEAAYFFGLGRENVIATSSYLNRGSQIKPILVAILNLEDSSKSNLVFAEDSNEFNNVVLLRIDCNILTDLELKVLKDKNKISRLDDGKGYINFGAIGDFRTLTNIRNFISNVEFVYEENTFIKISKVSIPENYANFNNKLSDSIVKDRFINFGKLSLSGDEVIDSNEMEMPDSSNNDAKENLISSEVNDAINDINSILEEDLDVESKESKITVSVSTKDDNSLVSMVDEGDSLVSIEDNYENDFKEENLYKLFSIDENSILLELSIYRKKFFEMIQFIKNIVDLCGICKLDHIEVIDMGDEILNISLTISMNDTQSIDLINHILIKNGFDLR